MRELDNELGVEMIGLIEREEGIGLGSGGLTAGSHLLDVWLPIGWMAWFRLSDSVTGSTRVSVVAVDGFDVSWSVF